MAELSKTERIALEDLYLFRNRAYVWKPATMKKLATKGLAQIITHLLPREAYIITEAGIKILRPEAITDG